MKMVVSVIPAAYLTFEARIKWTTLVSILASLTTGLGTERAWRK